MSEKIMNAKEYAFKFWRKDFEIEVEDVFETEGPNRYQVDEYYAVYDKMAQMYVGPEDGFGSIEDAEKWIENHLEDMWKLKRGG